MPARWHGPHRGYFADVASARALERSLEASAGCAGGLAGICDVAGQMRLLGFEFVDAVLHHVADAHDPSQAAVNHDRRVPDPVLGHDAHDLLNWGLWRDCVHLGCGDSGDRLRHHRGASLGQRPDDVPLTGDSVDRGAVVRDDDSTDSVFGEHREKVPHVGVRGDGDDLPALDAKYVADTHLALPGTGAGLIVCPPAPPGYYFSPRLPGR